MGYLFYYQLKLKMNKQAKFIKHVGDVFVRDCLAHAFTKCVFIGSSPRKGGRYS